MKRSKLLLRLLIITLFATAAIIAFTPALDNVQAFEGNKDPEFYLQKVDEKGRPVIGATFTFEGYYDGGSSPLTIYGEKPDGSSYDDSLTTWTSTEENDGIIKLTAMDYGDRAHITITETVTPPGYETAAPVKLVCWINSQGIQGSVNGVPEPVDSKTVITFVNKIKKHPVNISKKDGVGAFLEGAELEITGTDFTGDAVDKITITSATKASEIQLPAGKYKLHEKTAPKGYELAEDIEFEVTTDGTIKIGDDTVDEVVMTDEKQKTPKLSVTKTSSVTKAKPGDVIPYVITIKNSGDGDAEDVVVLDTMGNNLSYVSDDSNGVHDGQKVSWNVALAAGQTKTININCRINEDAAGKIINNVEITNVKGEYIEESGAGDECSIVLDEYEEEVAAKSAKKTKSAETGDESHALILITFALSLLMTLGMAIYRKQ